MFASAKCMRGLLMNTCTMWALLKEITLYHINSPYETCVLKILWPIVSVDAESFECSFSILWASNTEQQISIQLHPIVEDTKNSQVSQNKANIIFMDNTIGEQGLFYYIVSKHISQRAKCSFSPMNTLWVPHTHLVARNIHHSAKCGSILCCKY